jgi:hypothetical protein
LIPRGLGIVRGNHDSAVNRWKQSADHTSGA